MRLMVDFLIKIDVQYLAQIIIQWIKAIGKINNKHIMRIQSWMKIVTKL